MSCLSLKRWPVRQTTPNYLIYKLFFKPSKTKLQPHPISSESTWRLSWGTRIKNVSWLSWQRSISLFRDPHHLYPDLRRPQLLIEVIEALSALSSAFIVGDWVTYSQDSSGGFLIYNLTQVLQNGSTQAVQARTLNLQYEVGLVFFSPYENIWNKRRDKAQLMRDTSDNKKKLTRELNTLRCHSL